MFRLPLRVTVHAEDPGGASRQLALASCQGRAQVAGCQSQPASCQNQSPSPGASHQSRNHLPVASRQGQSQLPSARRQSQPPVASRCRSNRDPGPEAQRASAIFAEDEQRRAIARFRPFLQVAAIRVASPQPPRKASPDPYGFQEIIGQRQERAPPRCVLDARGMRSPLPRVAWARPPRR